MTISLNLFQVEDEKIFGWIFSKHHTDYYSPHVLVDSAPLTRLYLTLSRTLTSSNHFQFPASLILQSLRGAFVIFNHRNLFEKK